MWCLNPKPGRFFSVRCRKCKTCLSLRREDWAARTVWEILGADKAVFITLTFRRKPKDGYAEFQRYAKRLRQALCRRYGRTSRVRFVCASEFGERRGRYHLHGIICAIGCDPPVRFFRNRWKGGITHARAIGSVGAKRVSRYVAKYLAKAGRIRASNGFGTGSATQERIVTNVSRDATAAAIFQAFPGAQVVAVREAQGEKPVRAPYALRKRRKRAADVQRTFVGYVGGFRDVSVGPYDCVWGEFAPLHHCGAVYDDAPSELTDEDLRIEEEAA
nr:MAG: replication initiator protein [Microvirus sp.]